MKAFQTLLTTAVALAAGVSFQASAAETSSSFKSTASVASSCTIQSVGDISIGNYDPVVANAQMSASGQSMLQIRCTAGSSASFGLNGGLYNDSASSDCRFPSRNMADVSNNKLGYQLMATLPGGGAVSGCNEPGLDNHLPLVFASLESIDIDMRADAYGGQAVPTGSYSDTVTVKVTF